MPSDKSKIKSAESRAKTKAINTVACRVCGAAVGTACDVELSKARVVHLLRYRDALVVEHQWSAKKVCEL